MLVANEKPTGTNYTGTAALLMLGFLFVPAVLIVSRPLTDFSLAAAIACSLVCVGLARMNWVKVSRLSISSIAARGTNTK